MFPQSTIQLRSDDTVTIVVVLSMVMVVLSMVMVLMVICNPAFAQAGHHLLLRKTAANPGNF